MEPSLPAAELRGGESRLARRRSGKAIDAGRPTDEAWCTGPRPVRTADGLPCRRHRRAAGGVRVTQQAAASLRP